MNNVYTIQGSAISVNKMTIGKKVLTKEYRQFKEAMALELAFQRKTIRKDRNLTVIITFFLKELYRKDIDGGLKIVLDAGTEAGLWTDDRNIVTLVVKKVKSEKNYIQIEILER